MAASVRQSKFADSGSGGGATTIAATFDIPVLAGSTIVAYTTNDTGVAGTASVADNVNGAYPAALQTLNDAGNASRLQVFVFENAAAGATTVTVTWTGSVGARGIHIREVIGVPAASVDQSAGQNQATPGLGADAVTSGATPTLATTSSIALGMCSNSSGTNTPDVGAGFTSDGDVWSFFGSPHIGRPESRLVTGTTGVAATYTARANDAHQTIVVVLKSTPDSTTRYLRPATRADLDPGDGDFPAELVLKRWF